LANRFIPIPAFVCDMEANQATTTETLAEDKTAAIEEVKARSEGRTLSDEWTTEVQGSVFTARVSLTDTTSVEVWVEGVGHSFGDHTRVNVFDTSGESDTLLMDHKVNGFPEWLTTFADTARQL